MDIALENIIKKYCDDFNKVASDVDLKSRIVANSIPIIWFGNIDYYLSSPTKVVTVGLNPSCYEFLANDMRPLSHERFQKIVLHSYTQAEIVKLFHTLNAYYDGKDANPYMHYFNQYEELLHAVNASYFRSLYQNTAIHIDAYSAMATLPLWGKLDKYIQDTLKKRGVKLYEELVDYLQPDIILFSADRKTFADLYNNWILSATNEFANGVYINSYRNPLKGTQLLLHGRNFRGTPFGGLTRDAARAFIRKIMEQNE